MAEPEKFDTLMDMVNNHLAKTKLKNSDNMAKLGLPRNSSTNKSFTITPSVDLATTSIDPQTSSISEVLNFQISNMLKAKEKQRREAEKQQKLLEEKKMLAEKMRQLRIQEMEADKNILINLTAAVITSRSPTPPPEKEPKQKSLKHIAYECDLPPQELIFVGLEDEINSMIRGDRSLIREGCNNLPCNIDVSQILKRKRGKCSAFGKVVSSRYKRAPLLYWPEYIETTVEPFDFSTMSPCDINIENERKQYYNYI